MKTKDNKNNTFLIVKRTIRFLGPHKDKFIFAFICLMTSTILGICQPLILGKLIDYITYKKWDNLPKLLVLMIGISLISNFLINFYSYLVQIVSNKLQIEIKLKVFKSILLLSTKEFETTQKGELITKLEEDVGVIIRLLTNKVTIIIDILTVICIGIFLFKLNFKLALVTSINFPINFIMFLYFGKRISALEYNNRLEEDKCNNFIQEALNGFNIIKILNIKDTINNKFYLLNNNIFNILSKENNVDIISRISNDIVNCILYAAYFGIACYEIRKGNLTIGLFVAFNSYSSNFNNSLSKISQINMDLQQALISIKRIFNILDKNIEEENFINSKINNNIFKYDIKVKDLSFKYRENDPYILRNLNFNIKKNSITAIVGKNGQGKTTLLKILMGLYKNYEGKILFNNYSLNEIPFYKISEKISYVPQETFLFTGTIKENLLLANTKASDEDIKVACKLLNIDNVIESFKDGYDTEIGYNGISLSGGQKQRLGIARALLRKADLFLFDEITSSVDVETEEIIKNILKEISKTKTVILVTHKKNTLTIADNIIALDNG